MHREHARASALPAIVRIVTFAAVAAAALTPSAAQAAGFTDSVYREPAQVLVDIVDAPRTPVGSLSPDRQSLLLTTRQNYPSVEELSRPELGLAGQRINPANHAPSWTWSYVRLAFVSIADSEERVVTGLPENARVGNAEWSPDGSRIAFTNTTSDGVELWTADVESAEATRVLGPVLNLTAGAPPTWMRDGRTLLACLVADLGLAPEIEEPGVPTGPTIQENLGEEAPARTYQYLLEDEHDEELFEHYLTSQLALVTLDGEVTLVGEPTIVWDFDPSPDGEYVLVQSLHRPFSYLVTAWRFPMAIQVWDLDGNVVHEVADLPLRDQIPIARNSVAEGPRNVTWRPDAPATLYWAETLDGGDARVETEQRDRVFLLEAPFDGDPVPLITIPLRYSRILWAHDGLALVREWWWRTRTVRFWKVEPGDPDAEPELLIEYSYEDGYNHPGAPVTITNSYGRDVLMTADDANTIFMIGDGASPEGDRPFLDAFDTYHNETTRMFRSEAPYYEMPITPLNKDARQIVTERESVDEVTNFFVRDLADGSTRRLTSFPHPTPELVGYSKELIQYERADGVQLSGTLYLPPGYGPDQGPLPMVMWAYPREFKSASAAGQVDDSPYRFDWVGWWSPLLWLTQGYAVLDGPTMPIVGEGDEDPNDTHIDQLVASAAAAVDEVVRRGVADRHRIAIGGHSYGAFMTANLLAHSDLFAAGLARTGAYNRTLTPFGFQAEDRTLWEAPEVYFAMSPFMHADKVNEPILLVHGQADDNAGTFPMQSERFYNALKGHGAVARLVMLPSERHSYRARESLLHLLWETGRWLDTYVKNAEPSDGGGE
jgi:dipeptidyl aminopeptidase/acylaminoacyl peptidase